MTAIKKVIIVDDDPLSNFLCKETLKLSVGNLFVKDFTLASEALRFISENHPDNNEGGQTVLFLDLNMPMISGWEFLEKLSELDEPVKTKFDVYIISSSLDPNDEKRAGTLSNVKKYIIKPLTENILSGIFAGR